MNKIIAAAALIILGTAGQADSVLPKAHVSALACLENLDTTSTWNQCLGQLFAPCLGDDVGSESHSRCQITEFAGLTGEYAACLEGRSTAEYCILKD